jgi:hypothetical protein
VCQSPPGGSIACLVLVSTKQCLFLNQCHPPPITGLLTHVDMRDVLPDSGGHLTAASHPLHSKDNDQPQAELPTWLTCPHGMITDVGREEINAVAPEYWWGAGARTPANI